MHAPKFPLGVPLMDEDHAKLEDMLDELAGTPDADLPAFQERFYREMEEHFAREEALMQQHDVPVLHCHLAQHKRLLNELSDAMAIARSGNMAALRQHLSRDAASLLMSHVASVDQVTAQFLRGALDPAKTCGLRLPVDS